jgi:hypothetical protein
MTLKEAKVYASNVIDNHPEGCSCGADDCPSRWDADWDTLEYELIRDQTDWESPSQKRQFCEEHGIANI